MIDRRGKEHWTQSDDAVSALVLDGKTPLRSIGTSEIGVVYQPIVDLRNGRLFAAEALVRCKIPEHKNPEHLFAAAVREKASGRLGRTIREVAFAEAPAVPLFVNVHPDELNSRWFVRPDDPMHFHDQNVFLEITESAAFDHFGLVTSTLKEVCSRSGAKLVVDDFGAGYSNLKRVVDIEPAVVKLDRELISRLHESAKQRILVTHVVELCKALGARVVAEGIETLGELKAVRDCGVHFGQGYLLARPGNPMPSVEWPLASSSGSRPPRHASTKTKPSRDAGRPPPAARSRKSDRSALSEADTLPPLPRGGRGSR
ncbi:MAG: EAL domain-containing protein [Polyangiaceae bacterium]|nr:EAL domain-containing protein [Polyangiaceae bacterium]